jgi:zona occludens toxin
MAISIHHGANGSYKTAGVVQDFLLPAIKSGRHVVTNIRGVSRDRSMELIEDCHPDFDVTFVDTDTTAGRDEIARFWHWCPIGALLLFDEAGVLFPKRWRDSDIKKFDYPQGEHEGRPITFTEAFEMHRHYNWDIVLSAPNITLLRPDIRATTEGAYKHRNNKMIGLGGSYNEGFHSASENGSSPTQFLSVRRRKIKPIVFKLYDSTKTGKTSDSSTGTSLFYNGKLMVALACALPTIGYSIYSFSFNDPLAYESSTNLAHFEESLPVAVEAGLIKTNNIVGGGLPSWEVNSTYALGPFAGYEFEITAALSSPSKFLYYFNAVKSDGSFPITSTQLELAGYAVIRISDCAATIVYKAKRYNSTCVSVSKSAAGA